MRTTQNETAANMPLAGPRSALVHPEQVLNDHTLTVGEKRQLLASWASDAYAVEDAPSLRRLESGAIVRVADILLALKALPDDAQAGEQGDKAWPALSRRNRPRFTEWRRVSRPRHEDDDDPLGGAAALRLAPAYSVSA